MPTAPTASPAPSSSKSPGKFSYDKATFGGITVLTFHGTLDHAFEGRKVAEAIHTRKLVVNLHDVRRFASWGMSEWMDFLRISAERDLYIVECSAYAASQLNVVTGLAGHGKLVSFYAPFRCASCSEEFETLFLVPRDRATIRDLPNQTHECATCGGHVRLEEHPAAIFEAIATRPPFDIDDEVLALLRTRLDYDLPVDLTRFRAYRRARDGYCYVRLSGSVAAMPGERVAKACEGTTVVDLEHVVFDPAEVSQWRAFTKTAMASVKSLQLVDCPVGFLEAAVRPEDLHDKLKIRTFGLSYNCARCRKSTEHMVDVANNLEQLVVGVAPSVRCQTCAAMAVFEPTPDQLALFRALPARDRDVALDKFLAKARTEPPEKLDDCLVASVPKRPAAPTPGRTLYFVLALIVVVVAALGVVVAGLWKDHGEPVVVTQAPAAATQPTSAFVRPDWILSDSPSSAYCHDLINRLMCVGVSSYRTTRDEAVAEANDAALEELVNTVGLKISDAFVRENIIPDYSPIRAKALAELEAAELDRAGSAYAAADDVVDKARRRVVEALQASGGPAVPSRRTDWYWEEYAKKGGGTEILVFVRYDVSLDAVRALVDRYSATTPVLESVAMTAFPAMAWQYPDFTSGAIVAKVGRPLADAAIAAKDVITAVGDQTVGDTDGLVKQVDDWKKSAGPLKLTVKSGGAAGRVVEVHAHGR